MLCIAMAHDFRFQQLVCRQNGCPEPFAENGVGNALHADAGFSIVQQNAIAAIVMAADFPDQGIGMPSLTWRHEWQGTTLPTFDGWLLFAINTKWYRLPSLMHC